MHQPDENPNTNWLHTRGIYIVVLILIFTFRIAVAGIPGITVELSWTLTNVIFNSLTFIMFHWMTGLPFDFNQNEFVGLTLWEQIDNEQQFTPTRKYLTVLPILLFLLSTHYSRYDLATFMINLISLVIVLIAKLPSMHKVRLFGINKSF